MTQPSCIVASFDVPIIEPLMNYGLTYSQKKYWYSTQLNSPALRYVVATHCRSSKILWLSRAYPGGKSAPEILNEITPFLPQEKVMADRLFRFNHHCMVAEPYSCQYTKEFNSTRSSVERRIGVLRNWNVVRRDFGDER
mgnify:CR=1 FL=1